MTFLVPVTKLAQKSRDGTVDHFPEPKSQGEKVNRFENGHLPQGLSLIQKARQVTLLLSEPWGCSWSPFVVQPSGCLWTGDKLSKANVRSGMMESVYPFSRLFITQSECFIALHRGCHKTLF